MAFSRVFRNSDITWTKPVWESVESFSPHQQQGHNSNDRLNQEPGPAEPEPNEMFAQRIQEAFETGFHQGLLQGQQAARQELEEQFRNLSQTMAELTGMKQLMRKQAEADLVKLAFAIARRILRREVQLSPDALRGIVAVALERLASHEIYSVRTHPSQQAILRTLLAEISRTRSLEVVPDESLPLGSVLFQADCGALDASVETQLREVETGLADRLEIAR